MAGSYSRSAKESATVSHSCLELNLRCIRMSPPLREPGSVGSTRWKRAPIASVLDRIETSTRSRSSATTSRSRVTLYIAETVKVIGSGTESPCRLSSVFFYPRPPFAQSRIWPTLPRHLPPCLRAGQGPGDRDGIGQFLGPDRWAYEDVAQRHAPAAGAWRVFGEVGVDDRSGAAGLGHHPVDDEDQSVGHGSTQQSGQFPADLLPGLLCDAERWHRHESVDAAFEDTSRGGYTRGVESVGESHALVTQRVVAGDDDDCGR